MKVSLHCCIHLCHYSSTLLHCTASPTTQASSPVTQHSIAACACSLKTHHEDAVLGDGAEVRGLDTGPLRMRLLRPHPVSKNDVEATDGDLGGPGAVHQPHGGQRGRVVADPAPQTGHWNWTPRYCVASNSKLTLCNSK